MSFMLVGAVWRLDRSVVTPEEKILLLCLADAADEENYFTLHIANILRRTCLNEKELNKSMKSLTTKKLIRKVERKTEGEHYVIDI